MVTYSSCRLEYIRDNFPLCLSGQLWITGNVTGSCAVCAFTQLRFESQRMHNFHSQALDKFKSDNEPIYFNTFPHLRLQQIRNPRHAVWFLRHDWMITVRDWQFITDSTLNCYGQTVVCTNTCSFIPSSLWLWASSGPSLKWKLVTTFVFHSCSSDHNNCPGTRVCERLWSSHSFGVLCNVVTFQRCWGNSLTWRESGMFRRRNSSLLW